MTLTEIKEQIQQDIIAYMDGADDRVITELCQIVVDNFKKYTNDNA